MLHFVLQHVATFNQVFFFLDSMSDMCQIQSLGVSLAEDGCFLTVHDSIFGKFEPLTICQNQVGDTGHVGWAIYPASTLEN